MGANVGIDDAAVVSGRSSPSGVAGVAGPLRGVVAGLSRPVRVGHVWLAIALLAALACGLTSGATATPTRLAESAACFIAAVLLTARGGGSPLERAGLVAFALASASFGAMIALKTFTGEPPGFSTAFDAADFVQLFFYPVALVGLALVVHARLTVASARAWLDGMIVALGAGAVGSIAFQSAVLAHASGAALAFAVCDLTLAACTIGLIAVAGSELDRALAFVFGALFCFAAVHAFYGYAPGLGRYHPAGLLVLVRPAMLALAAICVWQMRREPAVVTDVGRGITLPVVFGVLAVGIHFAERSGQPSTAAIWLSGACLLAVIAQLVLTFSATRHLLAERSEQALTDPLTELSNRRSLTLDLDVALARRRGEQRVLLAVYDLDGFKAYNDAFGHNAGDALLRALAARFGATARRHGARGFRMGGDEFCALATLSPNKDPAPALRDLSAALSMRGREFGISASGGHALVETDGRDASGVIGEADRRMYENKRSARLSAFHQAKDVLLATQTAANQALSEHTTAVTVRAAQVARSLGLSDPEIQHVVHTADLHDIGKVAIPAEILHKPGALTETEWELVRQHTVIGEQIAAAAPALAPVAPLIRACHERYDGRGYPDGLTGEEIPLVAQIVFVCDAFDAMTSERCYHAALPAEEAFRRLRDNTGTQFAPHVVDAFCELFEAGTREAA